MSFQQKPGIPELKQLMLLDPLTKLVNRISIEQEMQFKEEEFHHGGSNQNIHHHIGTWQP